MGCAKVGEHGHGSYVPGAMALTLVLGLSCAAARVFVSNNLPGAAETIGISLLHSVFL
jgi:hypothetical protein